MPHSQDWPGCGQTTQSKWDPGTMHTILQTLWPTASPSTAGLAKRGTGAQHTPQQPGRRPQAYLVACIVCAAMAGPSARNGSASSPSLLLFLGHLACPGLCPQGWQLGAPTGLASGPLWCYKGHFLSLVEPVAQTGVPAGPVGEGGEEELRGCTANACLDYPRSASVLAMERPGAKYLL